VYLIKKSLFSGYQYPFLKKVHTRCSVFDGVVF